MAFSDTSGASGASDAQNTPIVRHHIERGDTATGADGGTIGTVVQLVMDRATGQPSAIVVHSDESNSEFELPWSHIVDTAGKQVQLDVRSKDIASVARSYNPEEYVPVDTGQAVPPTQADQIAQEEGRPVVTAVQPDAVELVEPQAPVDEATRPYASLPPSNLKRTAPLTAEPTAPTQPLAGRRQGASAEQGELKTETERETMKPAPNAPPVEPSPLTSTEGELVGGKPSTSGTGAASTVPTPGTEGSDEGLDSPAPSPADLAAPTSSAGRPEVSMSTRPVPDTTSTSVATPAMPQAATAPVSQFGGKVQQIGTTVQQRAQQMAATAQQTSKQVAQTAQQRSQQVRETVGERWNSPLAIGMAAAGLALGVIVGVIAAIHQRQAGKQASKQADSTPLKAQDVAGGMLKQAQASAQQVAGDTSRKAQDVALRAQEKAARTSLQAKRTAKRA
ncbi:MAG: PRC-barrel domain-containing protein, partial [Ktedonobacterales bacterium]